MKSRLPIFTFIFLFYFLAVFTLSNVYSQNYSLQFDGVDDYVDLGNSQDFNFNGDFTISLFFNEDSNETNGGIILDKMPYSVSTLENGYKISTHRNMGEIQFLIGDANAAYGVMYSEGHPYDVWIHVAGTFKGDTVTLYYNGVNVGSQKVTDTVSTTVPLWLGRAHDIPDQPHYEAFGGNLDNLVIWNRALTQQEIQDKMYKILNPAEETELVGYWRFNEGSDTTIYDASGNGHDGIIYGASWSSDEPFSPTLSAPILLVPADSSNNVILTPTLTWTSVENATSYQIQVSENSQFSSIVIYVSDISYTTYKVQSELNNSTWYHWRTRSMNSTDTSAWSTTSSFCTLASGSYSLSFNGTDNYLEIGNKQYFDFGGGSFSIAVWFKTTAISDGQLVIFMKSDRPITNNMYYVLGAIADRVEFNSNADPHPGMFAAISYTQVDDGNWHHLVGVRDSTDVILYIDGVTNSTQTQPWDMNRSTDNSGALRFGSGAYYEYNLQVHPEHKIDEISVWNRGLTQQEIQDMMYQPLNPAEETGLVAYWRFDEGTDTTVYDLSGNNNHGIIHGASWSTDVPPLEPSAVKTQNIIVKKFELKQNYPNPFNPSTQIKFSIPKTENVSIEVFNLLGQKVVTLLNKEMNAGYHEIKFNTQTLSSGVYFYSIQVGSFRDIKKMILLK